MNGPIRTPEQVLRDEILAQARAEGEETLRRIREEGESVVERARAEARAALDERLKAAERESARRRERILSTVPAEIARLRAARVENALEAVRREALRELRELAPSEPERREAVIGLAAEAAARMEGDAFVLRVSPRDFEAFGASLPGDLSRRLARSALEVSARADETVEPGGVVVEDREGRQVWDDRLASRLERLWPELRRRIAAGFGLSADGGGS